MLDFNNELIENKLKYLGLDINNIPEYLLEYKSLSFRPIESYDKTYKIYRDIDVENIQIFITNSDRLTNLQEKYKLAEPLSQYLDNRNKENEEKFSTFLKLLNDVNLEDIEEIEKEQELLNENIPFEVKYKNNFIWEIYYSDYDKKYFMLVPSREINNPELFYIIKKQIECKKENKNYKIFVPISQLNYTGNFLTNTEIADLENYIWYFTKRWPNIYEVYYKNNYDIKIVGEINVYENITSVYKVELKNKEECLEFYKLLKALFVISTSAETQYKFDFKINQKAGIDITFNNQIIEYKDLPNFINSEINKKIEEIKNDDKDINDLKDLLGRYKRLVESQTEEYLQKQKQISIFLECKKSFIGKVKFFFKSKKTILKKIQKIEKEEKEKIEEEKEIVIEEKENYTIEDLIDICAKLETKSKQKKNINLDVKALELKHINLTKKIENAELYIKEIDSHKKNIFEFWKFTNKDEIPGLNEGEGEIENTNEKLTKSFDFDEDMEEFGVAVDELQRRKLSKNETDAILATRYTISSFNALENSYYGLNSDLESLKEEYKNELESSNYSEVDIFGSIGVKVQNINNKKHREIEKDKFKILNINSDTDIIGFMDTLKGYTNFINEAFNKIKLNRDISVYKFSEVEPRNLEILNLDSRKELENTQDGAILYKLNLKEGMPILFYSNIVFYENFNKTLPVGMNLSTEVLLKLKDMEKEIVSEKEFNINVIENQFKNTVKNVKVIEYNISNKAK